MNIIPSKKKCSTVCILGDKKLILYGRMRFFAWIFATFWWKELEIWFYFHKSVKYEIVFYCPLSITSRKNNKIKFLAFHISYKNEFKKKIEAFWRYTVEEFFVQKNIVIS